MRKVAVRADMRLNNVQYYFKTKYELIDGIFSQYLSDSKKTFAAYIEASGKEQSGLESFINSVCEEEQQEEEIVFSIALTALAESDAFRARLSDFYDDFYQQLTDFLKTISDKKEVDISVHHAASILLPFINGYGLVSKNLGVNAQASAQQLTELLSITLGTTLPKALN
jgi:AcrR family transcriptional regulator